MERISSEFKKNLLSILPVLAAAGARYVSYYGAGLKLLDPL
jgi:hypothetical protein